MLNKKCKNFQNIIGYNFNDKSLLIMALTHKSYAVECGINIYNERIEFLGDSILSMIVAEELYNRYKNETEGNLSKFKAYIVSMVNINSWAKKISLNEYMFLGKSEKKKKRSSFLCDVFEAVIGAIYLDGGFEKAKKFVVRFLNCQKKITINDYKSKLQEFVQFNYGETPRYEITKEIGPSHNRKFEAVVYVMNSISGKGIGYSKKTAHQSAAKQAIKNINNI
jgi:ribonuclease-3